ncbi:HU family DNA-binding protein [Paenibacillus odorifer]|uniref:HU family DNA-binding protein n=1 Tax=Paenibacillus odorifer TaxID=189426 RepID=UPI00096C2468|nr:HU family DNA-binding protein [Paenibacillus odorifer]OMD71203.1 transcriptional regulator [Paenibacillus odorifer]
MNKQDLILETVTKTGLDKKDVALVTETIFETITGVLASGDKVSLHGFGSFEVRERAARAGVNPKLLADLKTQGVDPELAKAQATIQIAESKAPAFKPATALKNAVKK